MKREHGTRAMYCREGCRCEACTAANSAYRWAERKKLGWDAPILKRLTVASGVGPDGGTMTVPAAVVAEAINALADEIRMTALSIMWRKRKKG